MSSSTASAENAAAEKAAKRRATLQAKRNAEAIASAQLGKDVKIVMQKKPKSKINKKKKNGGKDGVAKKWIYNYSLKINKKSGEAKLTLNKHKSKAKSAVGVTATVSASK